MSALLQASWARSFRKLPSVKCALTVCGLESDFQNDLVSSAKQKMRSVASKCDVIIITGRRCDSFIPGTRSTTEGRLAT